MTAGELLSEMAGRHVLVVGDLMLDEYIFGAATRISPEAPVMVIRKERSSHVPGGAGNVAKNVVALGGRASLVALVGCDEAGMRLTDGLSDGSFEEVELIQDASRPTTRKTRVLAENAHQVLRIDEESIAPLSVLLQGDLLERVSRIAQGVDAILLSDYQKGMLTPGVVRGIVAIGRKAGIPVVGNAKPSSVSSYSGATLVSLNRAETCGALGRESLPAELGIDAAREIAGRHGIQNVLVTLGKDGMAAAGEGIPDGVFVPAPPIEVADVAGAGDTVIATVALGLSKAELGRSIAPEVFHLAALTSSAVVRHVGVAVPTQDDLDEIQVQMVG